VPPDGGSPITNYKVYRGTVSGGETLLTTLGNTTSYDDAAVTNGTTYFYKVSAVNAVGEGAQSNEVSATPQAGVTVPSAPQNLTAAPAKGKGVQLNWSPPASNGGSPITGYNIYRGASAGGETLLTSVGNVTSFKDTSTTRGQTYYYKVTAVNAVGESPASNEANASAK
jgi:fibronectin type 3 domain-containing protein